jgi:4-hydroxy-2-oxoheptanedioate aldolase
VLEKTTEIVKACQARGVVVGNFTEVPDRTAFWTGRGLKYMSFSVDVGIFYEAGRNLMRALHLQGQQTVGSA